MSLTDTIVNEIRKRIDIRKISKMAEYLDCVLLTLALLVNFIMIGICAIFYLCWSKVFWREKHSFPTPEKTKYQPSLLKKDLEAAQFEHCYLPTHNSLGSGTSGPYYV